MATIDRRQTSAAELKMLKAHTPTSNKSRHSKLETLLNALALGAVVFADSPVVAEALKDLDKARRAEAAQGDQQQSALPQG